ncbi:MAG: protein phosphatase 2C domain-containing protein, partial [Anaerolineales bacterium]|nr:protein phosphatase 2C domain-containing protein [Anaerolineales bacterium]
MIPSEQPSFPVSIASHAGDGKHNEDRYAVEHYRLSEDKTAPSLLAVVADGIGASRAGQVAAQLAVDAVTRLVAQSDASQPSGILQAAIIQASQVILQRSETRREWQGMGSTFLCAWLVGDRLYSASVGDARLYLLRGHSLQLLNVVHHFPRDRQLLDKRAGDEDPLRGYLGAKTPVDAELRMRPADGGAPS